MIQVPSFIGRAQISPVSDFVSAGLVFGTFNKALTGLREMSNSLVSQGVNWFTGDKSGTSMLGNAAGMMNASSGIAASPALVFGLNKAEFAQRNSRENTSVDPANLRGGPQPKMVKAAPITTDEASQRSGLEKLLKPKAQLNKSSSVLSDVRGLGASLASAKLSVPFANSSNGMSGVMTGAADSPGGMLNPAISASAAAGINAMSLQEKSRVVGSRKSSGVVSALHPATCQFLSRINSSQGLMLRSGGAATSISGNLSNGVRRVTFATNADEQIITQAIYAASFAHFVAEDGIARDAARQAALQSGRLEPSGILELVCANWLDNSGDSFSKTELARQKFQQIVFEEAVIGSQQYLSRAVGNAYSHYLQDRFGDWTEQHESEARSLNQSSEKAEFSENRSLNPRTNSFFASRRQIPATSSHTVSVPISPVVSPFQSFDVEL
jgi:hypothetical protein